MTKDELKSLLESQTNDEFVDREIFGRRPSIFPSDQEYATWCQAVAAVLPLQTHDIRIVGSAATGYSLSPLKAGRPFRRGGSTGIASDIDVALMSDGLFEAAWNTILFLDRRRGLRMSKDERTKMRVDVYWGVVGQRSLPSNTEPARQVLTAVSIATRTPPIRGHIVRCRIYRRKEDLRAYHIDSLRQLRVELAA